MTTSKMPTKLQHKIGENFDADLERIGRSRPTATSSSTPRRKSDRQSFVMPASMIEADPDQVRTIGKAADDAQLRELAQSIEEQGQRNPIEVREIVRNEKYRIVAGEGRFVAMTKILGRDEVRVSLVDATDEQILWLQLHENIHRRALHPLDLARAIQTAIDGGLNLDQVAAKVCKSKAWVQKALTIGRGLTTEAESILKDAGKANDVDIAYQVATVDSATQAKIATQVADKNLSRSATRELASTAKRDGAAHHSGRTGRKATKKPFAKQYKADNGLVISVKARKSRVSVNEQIEALESVTRTLRDSGGRKAA